MLKSVFFSEISRGLTVTKTGIISILNTSSLKLKFCVTVPPKLKI